MQACLDRALGAKQYYSDAFPVYGTLYYGAPFELRTEKRETYSVEAVNADLRHYLKRLARIKIFFTQSTSPSETSWLVRLLLPSETDHETQVPKIFCSLD